jgi:glutathione synthase/RimK-type ligase-like ATP-grasp enzyme
LLTDYNGFYRVGYHSVSLNKDTLKKAFLEIGHELKEYRICDVMNKDLSEFKNKVIIYCTAPQYSYRDYVKDLLYELSKENYTMPEFNMVMAYEDKGYQMLHADREGLKMPKTLYFGCIEDLEKYKKLLTVPKDTKDIDSEKLLTVPKDEKLLTVPFVFKTVGGAGSSGVMLINSYEELLKVVRKLYYKKDLLYDFKRIIKKLFFKERYKNSYYGLTSRCNGQFILQEYIPGLDSDYKVLVFDKNYYVDRRWVRDNDFRASGSGKNTFPEDPPAEVLNFAREQFEKLDIPMASLDIAFNGSECWLIEYHGIHFSLIPLVETRVYFTWTDKGWVKQDHKMLPEVEFANAFSAYMARKGLGK